MKQTSETKATAIISGRCTTRYLTSLRSDSADVRDTKCLSTFCERTFALAARFFAAVAPVIGARMSNCTSAGTSLLDAGAVQIVNLRTVSTVTHP